MITYKKISTRIEKWGIDIVVQFTDDSDNSEKTITFKFVDEKQIESEFVARMQNAIAHMEAEKSAPVELAPDVVLAEIEKILISKGTVTTAEVAAIKAAPRTVNKIEAIEELL